MSELERYETPALQSGDIAAWANDFTTVAGIAGQLAQTAFIPASLKVMRNGRDYDPAATAAQVAAAILTGRELGLDPMAALRSVDVIQGTPALRAIALRGVLQAAGHDIWIEEATNSRAVVAGQRKGSDHVQRITWTVDDAKSRNLAGKPNWRSQPRNMLIARATADVARLVAADALLGLPYTAEELEDGDTPDVQAAGSPPAPLSGLRKARRSPPSGRAVLAAAPDEPAPDEPASLPVVKPDTAQPQPDEPSLDDTLEQPGPATITPPQSRLMHALFNEQNFIDRDDRLAYVRQTIDRDIESSAELTLDEASTVIDALQQLPPIA
jgi:hypothetical protein